jgi:hypothetical protein
MRYLRRKPIGDPERCDNFLIGSGDEHEPIDLRYLNRDSQSNP